MRRFSMVFALGLSLLAASRGRAEVKPHTLFADHAVLQQGIKLPVWGTAEPGEKVTVKFQDQEQSATASDSGAWRVNLAPLKAGGPFEMTIAGKNTVAIKDLLVGEVWICSGQSNMEWPMTATRDSQKNIKEANYPEIRLFRTPKAMTPKPLTEFAPTKNAAEGKWTECDPKSVADFSAVAYFFGRKLHQERKVPIGLIQTAWGGTAAELWTREEIFDQYKELKGLKGSTLYNAMIAPLIPYGIKGAIWYQGESNVNKAWQYRTLFPAMIKNWRDDWKQGDFPFLFVQIAPYSAFYGPDHLPVLREAQLYTAQTVPNTAMAVINDFGDDGDIHPVDKDPVGVRLGLGALALAYKQDVPYNGPIYAASKVDGSRMLLSFKHAAKGLVAQELSIPLTAREVKDKEKKIVVTKKTTIDIKGGALVGFTIAGKDGKFVEANAKIEGDMIAVSSPSVSEPVAVRYMWGNTAVGNLFNGVGLPATPFRTDEFPVPTQPTAK